MKTILSISYVIAIAIIIWSMAKGITSGSEWYLLVPIVPVAIAMALYQLATKER